LNETDNPNDDPEIRKQSADRARRRHAAGEFPEPWSKGKTWREDLRIRHGFTGSLSTNWKGGTSTVTQRLRGGALYRLWKFPILQRDSFACVRCQRNSTETKLHVHHDDERFATILQKCLLELFPDAHEREISFEEGFRVIEAVVDYHVQKNVSGVTLCVDCHRDIHSDMKLSTAL
jgi:hypothetical protein